MSVLNSKDLTLVVGDVHIAPGQNLRRAEWLGATIAELNPNRVVFIGDMITFDSLSGWDKDKRLKMEGRRYQKDIDSAAEFLSRMRKAYVKKLDKHPKFILCEGNHEDRLRRYLAHDPTFLGSVDYVDDLGLYDWEVVPYKEYYEYKGISFTHVPINEAGKAIGGKLVASRALDICNGSVVFGHTHRLAYESTHRHGSKHLSQALNVGCFFEHIDEYARGSVTSYWRGIVLVDHREHGRFDFTPISLGKLRNTYGTKSTG